MSVDQGAAVGDAGLRRRTLAVVSAGVHEPSATQTLAAGLAAATRAAAAKIGLETAVISVELREIAADLANASIGQSASAALATSIRAVTHADALIAVTPVFAASYAGIFKSFFDVLAPDALAGMPTLLGATGGSLRHSLMIDQAMRPLLAYFRAVAMPTAVFVTPDDGDPRSVRRVEGRITRAGTELAAQLIVRGGRQPA